MSHFAQVIDNRVQQVIVAEQDFIDAWRVGDPAEWIQASYNTRGNVHLGPDGLPDGGIALRGNYPGIGDIYDPANDVFYTQQPWPSWILNTTTWLWESPVPYPTDDQYYVWDETTISWILK